MHQVHPICLIYTLGQYLRVKNDIIDFAFLLIAVKYFYSKRPYHLIKIPTRKSRYKLLASIMMVNAIREPNSLKINLQCLKLFTLPISLIMEIDLFQHLANANIVSAKLVERDITATKSGLRKIVDI